MSNRGRQRPGGAAPPQSEGDLLGQALRTAARAFGVPAVRFVPAGERASVSWGALDGVEDTSLDRVLRAERPQDLARTIPALRFLAAARATGAEGHRLGRLCLLDAEPRPFTPADRALLAEFAALVGQAVEGDEEQRRAAQTLRERQALLRQVVGHLPVVIYMADRDGWFSISEGRGLASLADRPSAVGQNLYERYRDVPGVLEPLKRTLAGSDERFTNEIQGIVYEDRTAPLRDEHGEIVGLVGVSMDVTEREERARALRESEARLRSLVENTPVILFVLDREGVFRVSEGRGLTAIGLVPGEHVGQSVFDLYADLPDELAYVRRALAGESVGWTLPLRGVYLETRLKPVFDEAGAVAEVIGVTYDVTERVEAEIALREATRRAEEANRMQAAFLANMSHEIRTPLTAILGFAELLADDVPPEHSDVPGLILQGGRRLMDTLNSVLDLARIEARRVDVQLAPTDLADEVAATVRLLGPLAERKGLRLAFRTLVAPGPVLADRAALARIVNNLVGNAIKFTHEGGIVVEVGEEGAEAVLRVRDTGEGIAEAFVPRLFDAFRQESDGIGRRHEGSGLGLTITKRLVEMMSGRIEVQSRKGEGSTFTVRLPRLHGGGDGGTIHPSLAAAVRAHTAG